jgi:hypothetical protein
MCHNPRGLHGLLQGWLHLQLLPYHLQGRSIRQARNQYDLGSKQATRFMLVSCLACLSILKKKTASSSETSVNVPWTIRRYIQEVRILLKCIWWANLKPIMNYELKKNICSFTWRLFISCSLQLRRKTDKVVSVILCDRILKTKRVTYNSMDKTTSNTPIWAM